MTGRVYTPADVVIAYKNVAATQDGQVVLHDLVRKFAYAQQSMFKLANQDMNAVLHMEGQRSVVVYIGVMIETDPTMVEQAGTTVHDEITDDEPTLGDDDISDLW